MDRNPYALYFGALFSTSLSARRAWIEMWHIHGFLRGLPKVALRKESVDRNTGTLDPKKYDRVALRKESVDRNSFCAEFIILQMVALRKESVDRNKNTPCHN